MPKSSFVVGERGEQVVRRGDGVHVAREVQVDALGQARPRAPAAGAAALGAEHRVRAKAREARRRRECRPARPPGCL